ncbi:MAG: V-type ATP synthase subunit I [Bacillota bacterium]
MAIAKMKKLSLIALQKDRDGLLKALQRMGSVHIAKGQVEEHPVGITGNCPAETEQKLSEIKAALSFLNKYDKSKKSLLSAKPGIGMAEFNAIAQNGSETDAVIGRIKSIDERLIALRSQKARIINRIGALKPYVKFDAPLEAVQHTQNTKAYLGVIHSNAGDALLKICDKYQGLVCVEKLDTAMEYLSIFAVAHKRIAAEFLNDLKAVYFSEFSIGEYTGTPKDVIEGLENEILQTDRMMEKAEEEAAALVKEKEPLKILEDYYATELERVRAEDLLFETEKTFCLEGWIIAGNEKRIEDGIQKVTGRYYIDFRDPLKDEPFPVALVNERIFRPYEAVIEMYAMPDPGGVDATKLIAPFYFIFFGMMVSDAGYGIVLTLLSVFMLKKLKPAGMFKKILGIVATGGISTLVWGALYGGWFGFELPALWFNPMKEPMTALILCLGLGFVHVLTGLFIGAVICMRRGQWADAVFDKILWIVLLVGLPMLAFGGTLASVGTYLSIIGVAGILLTNGRSKKGILKKFVGGFASLYGISGYLSDVLSYSRLFGMGLATGVIAMVFNTIAGLLTGQWYGYIFAAAIFLVGHAFNIGVNALGAYVQSCRLMYIEYFSKFYEVGGKPYKPLALKLKHYRLEN